MNKDILSEIQFHLDAIALLIKKELDNEDGPPIFEPGTHDADHPEKKE